MDNEVTTIFSKDPKQRVALVAFNSEVSVFAIHRAMYNVYMYSDR